MDHASLPLSDLAQLLTAAKSFSSGRIIADPRWNERGLHARRVQLAVGLNRWRRARLGFALDAAARQAFDRDGYVVRADFLARPVFEALREQVQALKTEVRERAEGSSLLRKIPIDAPVLRAIPALRVLQNDARFRALMAYGEGNRTSPQLYLQAVVQRPGQGRPDPQRSLHRDTFHPTVKAWLYLNDVAETAGPLVYVPGSHRLNQARLDWEREKSVVASLDPSQRNSSFRITEQELSALGCARPRPLAVSANTLIVADTFGFHARGTSLSPSQRLEVWATGRRSPFLGYWLDLALQHLTGSARHVRWRTPSQNTGFAAPK